MIKRIAYPVEIKQEAIRMKCAKSVALGVQIHQVEEIYVENKKLDESDRELLEELVQREQKKGYIRVDMEFNERYNPIRKEKIS